MGNSHSKSAAVTPTTYPVPLSLNARPFTYSRTHANLHTSATAHTSSPKSAATSVVSPSGWSATTEVYTTDIVATATNRHVVNMVETPYTLVTTFVATAYGSGINGTRATMIRTATDTLTIPALPQASSGKHHGHRKSKTHKTRKTRDPARASWYPDSAKQSRTVVLAVRDESSTATMSESAPVASIIVIPSTTSSASEPTTLAARFITCEDCHDDKDDKPEEESDDEDEDDDDDEDDDEKVSTETSSSSAKLSKRVVVQTYFVTETVQRSKAVASPSEIVMAA